MSTIKPFRALRPSTEHAKQVSCVPYDVVGDEEVRGYLRDNPLSFLQVTRAEATFERDEHPTDSEVFERARINLERLIHDGVYQTDPAEAVYVYQLSSDEHTQTGIVACCSLQEYESGSIKKHENVRPDKVVDRTEHLLAVKAQTGLILLAVRGTEAIRRLLQDAAEGEPLYSFTCPDGIEQRVWRVTQTDAWINAFGEVDSLYIADGHHRIESARLARERLRNAEPLYSGQEDYNFVVAGVFPAEDLRILSYNRIMRGLNGLTPEEFLDKVREHFTIEKTTEKIPPIRGEFCIYLGGEWFKLCLMGQSPDHDELDVSILQRLILDPVLGVDDITTDERVSFVGGQHSVDEIERVVDGGDATVGFSLFPTTMDDLLTVSDRNEIMPPKSTWFDPKLKDGLLVHLI